MPEAESKSVPSDIAQMSKLQKLAALLIIVGPEAAAQVMKNLGETELEAVATEMTKIPSISHEMQVALLKDFSAVAHVVKGKGIPPFLILHVADHPDNSAQAQRLGAVLKDAGVPTTIFPARNTHHVPLNDNLGMEGDPATKALSEFVDRVLKK